MLDPTLLLPGASPFIGSLAVLGPLPFIGSIADCWVPCHCPPCSMKGAWLVPGGPFSLTAGQPLQVPSLLLLVRVLPCCVPGQPLPTAFWVPGRMFSATF